MSYTSIAVLCSLILLLGMIIAFETGRHIGIRWLAEEQAANGLLDGAVFGLLGLLLAFTFKGAASRFEHRKDLLLVQDLTQFSEGEYLSSCCWLKTNFRRTPLLTRKLD
jgi:hypothetical protein